MGRRGPVPKSNRGRLSKDRDRQNNIIQLTGAVKPPPAKSNWHPGARALYRSLIDSGQSDLYEPSDWAAARVAATVLTRFLKNPDAPLGLLDRAMAIFRSLGITHPDRLRMHLEIYRDEDAEPVAVGQTGRLDRIEELKRELYPDGK